MPTRPLRHLKQGFTLIELAITVALVAILASVAYPSFMDAIYKGRRSEAFSAITTLQLAQERWRANNASYTNNFSNLNLQSGGRNYTLSIPEASANAYRLRATATGRQANDSRCATMEVRVEGGSIQYGSSCATCTPGATLTDANRCWSRQ